jgi:hypothetical protein
LADQQQYAAYQQLAVIGMLKGRASEKSFAEWKAAKDEALREQKLKLENEQKMIASQSVESRALQIAEKEAKYKAWLNEKQNQIEKAK